VNEQERRLDRRARRVHGEVATIQRRAHEQLKRAREALVRSGEHLDRSEEALRRSSAHIKRDRAEIDREAAASVRAEMGDQQPAQDVLRHALRLVVPFVAAVLLAWSAD
jgi:hypothetical protein